MKADSTLRTSRAVPHPGTYRALFRLTSEVERYPVHSTRYGRQRTPGWDSALLRRLPKLKLLSGMSHSTSFYDWEEARKHKEAKTTTRTPNHIQHKLINCTHGLTPAGPRCELSQVRGKKSTI